MEDKINEIREQMEKTRNEYMSKIDSLREEYNSRMSELEGQGLSYGEMGLDPEIQRLDNEMTTLSDELTGVLNDLENQLSLAEDKANRISDINAQIQNRMSELEAQGISYGEMYMDPEVIRLNEEIDSIINEVTKEEQEKNDAIKEYGDLKNQKSELESQLEEAKKSYEEQNASLEKEKAGRVARMKELEARNRTDDPEYKEYASDIEKIQKELDENKNKTKIDELTKNISDIDARMAELEEKFGKEVLEPVEPEPEKQPKFEPQPEPQPEPEPRRYGRRMKSEPKSYRQTQEEAKDIKYEQEPLTAVDSFAMAKAAYEMMTDEDKDYLEYAKEQLTGTEYLQFMQEKFPQLLQGNSEVEQRMICDALNVIHNNEMRKAQEQHTQPQPQPQPQSQPQPQPQPQQPTGITIEELMEDVKLDTIQVDLSTGKLCVVLRDDRTPIFSYRNLDLNEKVSPRKTRRDLKENGIEMDDNMDPIMVEMICNAIDDYFEQLGIPRKQITPDVYAEYISQYGEALNLDQEDEDKATSMPIIEYIKSDPDKVIDDARGKTLDKIFRPYMREAQFSPATVIDETIDTRNWFERFTDRLRSIFNPQKQIPDNIQEAMRDHQDDPEPEPEQPKEKRKIREVLKDWFKSVKEGSQSKIVTGPFRDDSQEPSQGENLGKKLNDQYREHKRQEENKPKTIEGTFKDATEQEQNQDSHDDPEQ